MKAYIASNYSHRNDLALKIVPQLEALGLTITSSWLKQTHEDRAPEKQEGYALQDLEDIDAADFLIYYSTQIGWKPGRGKHIEFGYAYAKKMQIFCIGTENEESVFYFLPGVMRFVGIGGFIDYYKSIQPVETLTIPVVVVDLTQES